MSKYILLAGRAKRALAQEIVKELGICEGAVALKRFPDGESAVQLLEPVLRKWVFLVQPTSGGTIAKSVEALLQAGAAREIYVAATHGLLVVEARAQLSHECIKALWITNTISPPATNWPQLQVVSVAPLIAETIEQLTKVDEAK